MIGRHYVSAYISVFMVAMTLMIMATAASAFTGVSNTKFSKPIDTIDTSATYNHIHGYRRGSVSIPLSRLNAGGPIGPVARAKKLMDPEDYNRVVEEKMKREKMTRAEAEADYNSFLENPPFYYALEKKEEYYKSLGYKDIFEGMIGEAEKEGKGDEMRERISSFKRRSKLKAAGVLVLAIVGLFYFQTVFNENPLILKGGLPDYSRGSLL